MVGYTSIRNYRCRWSDTPLYGSVSCCSVCDYALCVVGVVGGLSLSSLTLVSLSHSDVYTYDVGQYQYIYIRYVKNERGKNKNLNLLPE